MRRVRVDIAGNTDANGNFSQTIRLDRTGEWRNLKVAIGTSGPAEWALTSSGTPLTYGRGRRVTLGPELLEPFDTLVVSCTGGPASQAVAGSCTGQAGTEQEIVAAYVPAPNTIALDSLVTQRQIDSFTQAPNTVVTGRIYSLPVGTQSVRVQLNQNASNVTFSNFKVTGNGTGDVYVFTSSGSGTGGFDEWFKPSPPDVAAGISFNLDTTGSANGVEVTITADLGMNYVVASLFGAGTAAGGPILVQVTSPNLERIPPDWQAKAIQNGAGGPASCNAPASAGKVAVLRKALFSVSAGSARIFNARVWDGTSGTTEIGVAVIGDPGAAVETAAPNVVIEFLKTTAGNQMTFDFDFAAAAGEQQAITASGWYV